MKSNLIHSIELLILGIILGIVSKLLDIYTTNLGVIFSSMAIWILICTIIAKKSKDNKLAGINVLLFCIGMVITYYVSAYLLKQEYDKSFIIGWTLFAISSPLLAVIVRYTNKENTLSLVIKILVIIFTAIIEIILFDKLRAADIVIILILIYILFIKKKKVEW